MPLPVLSSSWKILTVEQCFLCPGLEQTAASSSLSIVTEPLQHFVLGNTEAQFEISHCGWIAWAAAGQAAPLLSEGTKPGMSSYTDKISMCPWSTWVLSYHFPEPFFPFLSPSRDRHQLQLQLLGTKATPEAELPCEVLPSPIGQVLAFL